MSKIVSESRLALRGLGRRVVVTIPGVARDAGDRGSPTGTLAASFALDLTLTRPAVERAGELRALAESSDDDFIIVGFRAACARANVAAPASLHCRAVSSIPIAVGRGASAAALVAGVVAARGLLDLALDDATIAHLVADIDGSPAQAELTVASHAIRTITTCDDSPDAWQSHERHSSERGEQ